jgi:predicted MPP superfamily phosphohydrolase
MDDLVKVNGAKKYYDDYYEINNTKLYISSGIGTT